MTYIDNETAKPVVFFGYSSHAPEVGRSVKLHDVERHPRLGSFRGLDEWVNTSTVLDVRDEGRTIETLNTVYMKKERVMKSFPVLAYGYKGQCPRVRIGMEGPECEYHMSEAALPLDDNVEHKE